MRWLISYSATVTVRDRRGLVVGPNKFTTTVYADVHPVTWFEEKQRLYLETRALCPKENELVEAIHVDGILSAFEAPE